MQGLYKLVDRKVETGWADPPTRIAIATISPEGPARTPKVLCSLETLADGLLGEYPSTIPNGVP